jgi:hypothetical protein
MMNNRTVNLIPLVNTIYDHSGMYLSFLSGEGLLWTIGNSFAVVLALGMVFWAISPTAFLPQSGVGTAVLVPTF